jgi:hypothetical protein
MTNYRRIEFQPHLYDHDHMMESCSQIRTSGGTSSNNFGEWQGGGLDSSMRGLSCFNISSGIFYKELNLIICSSAQTTGGMSRPYTEAPRQNAWGAYRVGQRQKWSQGSLSAQGRQAGHGDGYMEIAISHGDLPATRSCIEMSQGG